MIVILLCAGYGTRLASDLENDKTKQFSYLVGIPKPLLPIHSKPLIEHWIDCCSRVDVISKINIITNEVHKNKYENFIQQYKSRSDFTISLLSDGSTANENRTGAVSCMLLGVQSSNEDCIVIAGDTLLDESFHLEQMIEKFMNLKENTEKKVCLLVSAPVTQENVSKHGIIEVDADSRVKNFLEKPNPNETESRLQSPCFYIMDHYCINVMNEFMKEVEGKPLSAKDATGNFIRFMVFHSAISTFAYHVPRRFDIGNLKSYLECLQSY